jgi:hypothetical protein
MIGSARWRPWTVVEPISRGAARQFKPPKTEAAGTSYGPKIASHGASEEPQYVVAISFHKSVIFFALFLKQFLWYVI